MGTRGHCVSRTGTNVFLSRSQILLPCGGRLPRRHLGGLPLGPEADRVSQIVIALYIACAIHAVAPLCPRYFSLSSAAPHFCTSALRTRLEAGCPATLFALTLPFAPLLSPSTSGYRTHRTSSRHSVDDIAGRSHPLSHLSRCSHLYSDLALRHRASVRRRLRYAYCLRRAQPRSPLSPHRVVPAGPLRQPPTARRALCHHLLWRGHSALAHRRLLHAFPRPSRRPPGPAAGATCSSSSPPSSPPNQPHVPKPSRDKKRCSANATATIADHTAASWPRKQCAGTCQLCDFLGRFRQSVFVK